MPSTSSRPSRGRARPVPAPAPARRPLARGLPPPAVPRRPEETPFAAALGCLLAAEYGYLGWLLWDPHSGLDWFVVAPAVLAAFAITGAVLLVLGRGRAWLVL